MDRVEHLSLAEQKEKTYFALVEKVRSLLFVDIHVTMFLSMNSIVCPFRKMSILAKLQSLQNNLTCYRYWENSSSVLQKHSRFEGIPENLLLNFSSWLVGI